MSCDLLNLIGAANIPAVPTKMCRVTRIFSSPPLFSARARGIAHTATENVWLASRETSDKGHAHENWRHQRRSAHSLLIILVTSEPKKHFLSLKNGN